MKKLFMLAFLSLLNLSLIKASEPASPRSNAKRIFEAQENLPKTQGSAFFGLLETLEAYYRAQAVVRDLESVIRYFEGLGFDTDVLKKIPGKVEEQINVLKDVKKLFKTPKEQTKE